VNKGASMNKLRTMLVAACTLMLASMSTAQADSSNFAGPYIGLSASGYGIEAAGSSDSGDASTAADVTTRKKDEISVGKVAGVMGVEAGYVVPLGTSFAVDVGATYVSGEAKIEHLSDDAEGRADVKFKIDDLVTYYIAPTLVLSDTSSVYIKVGLTESDIGVEGDITTPADLSGTTWGLGTRTVLDSGIFIRTEAGFTEFNGISAQGKGSGTNPIKVTSHYSAEPTYAYGKFSLGFRF